jgi:hypothetical protein
MKITFKVFSTFILALAVLGIAQMSQAYCHPQCVDHARDKSHIWTCRLGADSTAVRWFNCERANGRTTNKPKKGRVLILSPNQHGIGYTGHAMYIKKKKSKGRGKYSLRLTHTNYDGHCAGPEKCKAKYYRYKKKLKIKTGVWAGRKFKVEGIIKK